MRTRGRRCREPSGPVSRTARSAVPWDAGGGRHGADHVARRAVSRKVPLQGAARRRPIVVRRWPRRRAVIDGQDATTAADMGYATVAGQARRDPRSIGDDDEWGDKLAYDQGCTSQRLPPLRLHRRGRDRRSVRRERRGIFVGTAAHHDQRGGTGVERQWTVRGVGRLESCAHVRSCWSTVCARQRHARRRCHRRHNITEADGMLFQFNETGPLMPGAMGAARRTARPARSCATTGSPVGRARSIWSSRALRRWWRRSRLSATLVRAMRSSTTPDARADPQQHDPLRRRQWPDRQPPQGELRSTTR